MNGKEKCEFLKGIRQQIAELNGIEYLSAPCTHTGPCKGTCPKCEAETRWINAEIARKIQEGIVVQIPNFVIEEPVKPIALEDLNLSVKAYNVLKKAGIQSFDDLLYISEEELYRIPGMCFDVAGKIINKVHELGFRLSDPEAMIEGDVEEIVQIGSTLEFD